MNKLILDATCSTRTIWLPENKKHPDVLYIDIREETDPAYCRAPHHTTSDTSIQPDEIQDFRDLPYPDKSFKLIVFDPPHIVTPEGLNKLTGIITKKYGALHAETWQSDLKKGFKELWRVLDDNGVLIFKFHDVHIDHNKVLKLAPVPPLFGTTTSKKGHNTCKWFTFMKISH